MAATDLEPLDIWRRAMVDNVRRDAPDLSARQMALLLTVYMTEPPHTVRGLAEILNVSKPAITRALDRLGEFGLARRKTDPRDRRSVVVQRTVKGSVYLAEFADIIAAAKVECERERAAEAARQAERQARKKTSAKSAAKARKAPARATAASRPAAVDTTKPAKEPANN
jgi:DNA-binding MarR family transcriptional regulator